MTIKTVKQMSAHDSIASEMDKISQESITQAWEFYRSKPEYKEFNKHDLIDSLLSKSTRQDDEEQNH